MLSCVVTTIQNSTRARQSASLVTREERYDASPNSTSSSSSQHLAPSFRNPWQPCGGRLIANPRLESRLSSNSRSQLQISNRERMAICRFTPSSRPALFRLSLATRQWLVLKRPRVNGGSLPTTFLIVTPRLESPATPTKQNANPISSRYKSPFFAPLSRTSPSTRYSSLVSCHPALAPVAPTSRKAIMSRNHFTQIPRSEPLKRKVTNADPNQS